LTGGGREAAQYNEFVRELPAPKLAAFKIEFHAASLFKTKFSYENFNYVSKQRLLLLLLGIDLLAISA
jgi:hypothetical protein